MAAKQILLRCKSKKGLHTLDTLSGESTVGDLKACLSGVTGIDQNSLKVLTGFPPKFLDLANDNCKLDSLPLQSGETLIIEESKISDISQPKNLPCNNTSELPTIPNDQNGVLLRHVVPANNSCLFTSIYFSVSGGDHDLSCSSTLRQVIADAVAADPTTYTDAFLGKPNKQYCTWILNEEHWGGAIEISILSKYYGLEIVAIDTQNLHLHRFGESYNYDYRILLIYDGIHYDALVLDPLDPTQQVQTFFSTTNESILQMAMEIAKEAKSSRQFTDVKNFALRCLICNVGLRGQEEAREHAMNTNHINFSEM